MAEIRIALAGNPNCGKTTLFNALTGSNQYVGNWPGVTVEKKEGRVKNHKDVVIQDLPGIYSLSPYTLEEVVTRNYLVNDKPDAILNIIDGTNIERNLYLTTQLLEIGLPVVVAVNMIDLVRKNGDEIDLDKLSKELGCPCVEISALKGIGYDELVAKAIETAENHKAGELPHVFTGAVEHAVAHIEDAIKGKVSETNLRWFAVKLFERDEKIVESLALDASTSQVIEEAIKSAEKELDDDAESIVTNQRYAYIANVLSAAIKKKNVGKLTVSDKIDRIVTNRWLALPIFAAIMVFIYWVAVATLGTYVTDWTNDVLFGEWIQGSVQTLMENAGVSEWLVSLVVDGILGGIAAPVGFAPQMAIVFFFQAILEDCGYMARVAFIMDRIFRRFGLSGKSFISFMISSGCGIPGIMATRTIENEQDRRLTMLTTTFVPCGAKLPVIGLIAGVLATGIDESLWWVSPAMYFIGIGSVILVCIVLKKTSWYAGEPAPFVMELPAYHFPSVKGVLLRVWERTWAFLKKAGTILFVCCAVMWFLGTFGIQDGVFGMVETESCFLAVIGNAIAWIFKPLGFGTWQAVASSLSGFVAKEQIVSTMGVLSSLAEGVEEYEASMHDAFAAFFTAGGVFNPCAAFAFLCFNLLDSPCLAAISSLAKELGNGKDVARALLIQNGYAYGITLCIYQFSALALGYTTFGIGTIAAIVVAALFLYLLFRPASKKLA